MNNLYLVVYLLLLFITSVQSQGLERKKLPLLLKDWQEWVLRDVEDFNCPSAFNESEQRHCFWPKNLNLSVERQGGSFKGEWHLFKAEEIELPGSYQTVWPKNVRSGGRELPVINKNGRPYVFLSEGSYSILGEFSWSKTPTSISLPNGVGIFSLNLLGKQIPFPNFGKDGSLWIKGNETLKGKDQDYLEVKVYRKLIDNIPANIETYLKLKVGGGERELTIPSTLLNEFIPVSSNSSLPHQWNPNGELKIRIKAGEWFVLLKSRKMTALKELIPIIKSAPLPEEEVWVFKGMNEFRVTNISGVDQIDSQRADLPPSFQGLPTYLVKKDSRFNVSEKSRGQKFVPENNLNLLRTLWLDFDGVAYTVQDEISGVMNKGWRLDMSAPYFLGSFKQGNQNQLITNLEAESIRGVEVREKNIAITTEGRIQRTGTKIEGMGWNQDFNSAKGTLHLPPGWRSLALIGPDYARGTWLSKWSLLNLFFVLLMTIGIFKLKNLKWSLITFFGLSLLIHEPNAPYWIWLHLLIALSLEKGLQDKFKFSHLIRYYRFATIGFILIISFPFIVEQIQKTIYPSLEKKNHYQSFYSSLNSSSSVSRQRGSQKLKKGHTKRADLMESTAVQSLGNKELNDEQDYGGAAPSAPKLFKANLNEYDPKAQIQTGPGIPQWKWGTIDFGWDGPVTKEQSVQLIALSPVLNKIVTLFRIILLLFLIYCFMDWESLKKSRNLKFLKELLPKMSLFFIALIGTQILIHQDLQAQTIPSPQLLKELKEELLKPEECLPNCASLGAVNMTFNENALKIQLMVHVVKESFIPIPGQREQWLPQSILVNGRGDSLIKREDTGLFLTLKPGVNNIVLQGALPIRSQVQINFPMAPVEFSYKGKGWSLEGLDSKKKVNGSITLNRLSKGDENVSKLESSLLPQFLQIKREFHFRVSWTVITTITRMTPPDQAVTFSFPKLVGETITSSNVVDSSDQVKINLGKGESRLSYSSILSQKSPLSLKATSSSLWTEVWEFHPGPIWRVGFESLTKGLERTTLLANNYNFSPIYHPWPNEALRVTIDKPQGASGKTITLNDTFLEISPGKRSTQYSLKATFKTSLGLTHNISLPEDIKIQAIKINNKIQTVELNKGFLALPFGVGEQKVEVLWNQKIGLTGNFKNPKVDLGLEGINLKIKVNIPRERWILAVGGPVMGPAVLFWGKLFALIILAFFLGKISWCPLSFLQWSLLFIGLTQGESSGIMFVTGYILFLCLRKSTFKTNRPWVYNLQSLLAIIGAFICIGTLITILSNGLLGGPIMGIVGNDSTAYVLNWFADRFLSTVPNIWIFSLPTFAYQVLMLFWAIWMSLAVVKWVPWIWEGLYGDGFYKAFSLSWKAKKKVDKND
ncbi:MAG: hypothetical protein K9K67_07115 [Bacteriovoracaceae bacterium]|nr:hypothetical protein [Bacteriovoracaceae bacterium]